MPGHTTQRHRQSGEDAPQLCTQVYTEEHRSPPQYTHYHYVWPRHRAGGAGQRVRCAGLSPFWSRHRRRQQRPDPWGTRAAQGSRHPEALCSLGKFGSLNFHHFLFFRKNCHNYHVLSS